MGFQFIDISEVTRTYNEIEGYKKQLIRRIGENIYNLEKIMFNKPSQHGMDFNICLLAEETTRKRFIGTSEISWVGFTYDENISYPTIYVKFKSNQQERELRKFSTEQIYEIFFYVYCEIEHILKDTLGKDFNKEIKKQRYKEEFTNLIENLNPETHGKSSTTGN